MTGVVSLLKPPGMSSQTAVTRVRRLFGVPKAGHAGTLDPGATGVLLVCLGRATKLSRYLMDHPKEYVAEMLVGVATDTLDTYGSVVATSVVRPTEGQVRAVLGRFEGWIEQVPPVYSALKVGGTPMYELARRGAPVPRKPRRVFVERIELLSRAAPDRFLFRIACSKGTYVRSLLADIASNLGTAGCVSFLERTASGGFRVERASTLDEVARAVEAGEPLSVVMGAEQALGAPCVDLPPHLYDILLSGARIDLGRMGRLPLEEGRVYGVRCRGAFFGAGEVMDGQLAVTARILVQPAGLEAERAPARQSRQLHDSACKEEDGAQGCPSPYTR